MEIFILGSGVGVPSAERGYPGLFVRSGAARILMDPGPGSIRQLKKLGFTYRDVDLIALTHLHPDHCLDLISFLFACKYPLKPRKDDLSLIGPAGLSGFYKEITAIFGSAITPENFKVDIKEMTGGDITISGAKLTVKPVMHTDGSIGLRYECKNGKVLCYSGDTDYCGGIVELARKAHLLVLECSFPDEGKVKGHLTPSAAGRVAREALAEKLLLTHLYPVCDGYDLISQCRKEFSGDVSVAADLMRIEI